MDWKFNQWGKDNERVSKNLYGNHKFIFSSIIKCIDGGFTKDVLRAKEIYKFSFDESNNIQNKTSNANTSDYKWKRGVSINDEI